MVVINILYSGSVIDNWGIAMRQIGDYITSGYGGE